MLSVWWEWTCIEFIMVRQNLILKEDPQDAFQYIFDLKGFQGVVLLD